MSDFASTFGAELEKLQKTLLAAEPHQLELTAKVGIKRAMAEGRLDFLSQTLNEIERAQRKRRSGMLAASSAMEAQRLRTHAQKCVADCEQALEREDSAELERALLAATKFKFGPGLRHEPAIIKAKQRLSDLQEKVEFLEKEFIPAVRSLLIFALTLADTLQSAKLSSDPVKKAIRECKNIAENASGAETCLVQAFGADTLRRREATMHANFCLGGYLNLQHVQDKLEKFREKVTESLDVDVRAALEFMAAFDSMHDGMRSLADDFDIRCISDAVTFRSVSKVTQAAKRGDCRVCVPPSCPLLPGNEILLADEFHLVESLGSICLIARLRKNIPDGTDVKQVEISPVVPAERAEDGRTQAFIDEVESFNESSDPGDPRSADSVVNKYHGVTLEQDPKERQKQLVVSYSKDGLFPEVNKALYMNLRDDLHKFAGYIRELRDVFKVGRPDAILEPFSGDVVRGMKDWDGSKVDETTNRWKKGQKLCWAAFTSTSNSKTVKPAFRGHIEFRVRCNSNHAADGQYVPASIQEFSVFPNEVEVLFPPHCQLRFVNVSFKDDDKFKKVAVIELETEEFPCVWAVIEKQRWCEFEEWAERNSDSVDCRDRHHSVIVAVAESISRPLNEGEPDPIEVCLKHGASINEVAKDTLQSALATLVKRLVATDDHVVEQTIQDIVPFLFQKGASPFLKAKDGSSAAEMIDEEAKLAKLKREFATLGPSFGQGQWQYWVDDYVDNKEPGWYPFAAGASASVENAFEMWFTEKVSNLEALKSIKSGDWSYNISFVRMEQTNTRTGKQRNIQRSERSIQAARREAEVARDQGRQTEFEERSHLRLRSGLMKLLDQPDMRGYVGTCETLNGGPNASAVCRTCGWYHWWFCHYCRHAQTGDSCQNGCRWEEFGWSCISGRCADSQCVCRKGQDWWKKHAQLDGSVDGSYLCRQSVAMGNQPDDGSEEEDDEDEAEEEEEEEEGKSVSGVSGELTQQRVQSTELRVSQLPYSSHL